MEKPFWFSPSVFVGLVAVVIGSIYVLWNRPREIVVVQEEDIRRRRTLALERRHRETLPEGGEKPQSRPRLLEERSFEGSKEHSQKTSLLETKHNQEKETEWKELGAKAELLKTSFEEKKEAPSEDKTEDLPVNSRDLITNNKGLEEIEMKESPTGSPKKKKSKLLPPVQQLCEGISEAIQVEVTPTSGGRWNGTEGWCKRRKGMVHGSTMLLPLSDHAPTKINDDEWSDLLHALSRMPIPTGTFARQIKVEWAAAAHNSFRTQSQKFPKGKDCFHVAAKWVLSWTAGAIARDVAQLDDDDDQVPDLFRDETNDAPVKSMVDKLLNLAETAAVVHLTEPFLEGLWEAEKTLAPHVQDRLWRRLEEAWDRNDAVMIQTRLNAVSHIVSRSKSLQLLLASTFRQAAADQTGREMEESLPTSRLWSLAAYTLPIVADNPDQNSLFPKQMDKTLLDGDTSQDLGIAFFRNQSSASFIAFSDQVRGQMQSARGVGQLLLKLIMKSGDKTDVFRWLSRLAQANEALTGMLTADLLSSDGITTISSSWPFLLGVGSSLLGLCTGNLKKKFDKSGHGAFDIRYLDMNRLGLENENGAPLSAREEVENVSLDGVRFDGATEFFFVGAGLLHCSLYPLLRVEQSFHQKYDTVLRKLQELQTTPESHVPFNWSSASRTAVLGWMGFSFFLEDPRVVEDLTTFSLLQLQWILNVAEKTRKGEGLRKIPDWFCKEPSRWLSHIARTVSYIAPFQAEQAVEIITKLMTIGSEDKSLNAEAHSFSPVVLTELVRVAASFVQAGVRRSQRRRRGQDMIEPDADMDDPSLYVSLDKNHLGVVVFANDHVCDTLCPTLMKAFQAMDIVEGLNVDVEASFDKYSVKLEITYLITLLWGHPNGRCKLSIVALPDSEIACFVSSLGAALNFLLDDAIQRYSDVCRLQKQRHLTMQDKSFMERQSKGAAGNFLSARKLLLLLWKLSKEQRISTIVGSNKEVSKSMASLVIHFLDALTSQDGRTNTELETLHQNDTSYSVLCARPSLDDGKYRQAVSKIVSARRNLLRNYGLDVSTLSHLFLALVATFDAAARSGGQETSSILEALAIHEDYDIKRYKAIHHRLVPTSAAFPVSTSDVMDFVLTRDGHVGDDVWAAESSEPPTTEQKQRHVMSSQAQLSHATIQAHVGRDKISEMLATLDSTHIAFTSSAGRNTTIDVDVAIQNVLSHPSSDCNDFYVDAVRPWLVSSEPFADNSSTLKFLHYFDKTARSHGSISGSAKILVKEAKKCLKRIPTPHPNSSIFCCFAEERMDLCRAIVTGPVDTPYSLGIFVFDVFFPPSYPRVPPLLHFLTTGSGQVRFGPNLYQDGKVCLSLLGTFHAADESQQWNPNVSSLAQVLLSIQTQLLTADPYFNEPGHEAMAHTTAGQAASKRYNHSRRLDTMRHAILGPLLHAPLGFQDVVQRYFSLCRQQILVQSKRWWFESMGTSLAPRYEKVYKQIVAELAQLPLDPDEKVLAPRKEDVAFLRARDPSFRRWSLSSTTNTLEDTKPIAAPAISRARGSGSEHDKGLNPWAQSSSHQYAGAKLEEAEDDNEDKKPMATPAISPATGSGSEHESGFNPWAQLSSDHQYAGKTKDETEDDNEDDFYS